MHETATLHFDFSHLSPDQPFTLHAGSRQYDLTRHTRQSLARARRSNAALALVPDSRVTHFSGPVRLPGTSPLLLRVTAPKRRPDDLLDRLVLTALQLPRRHRIAGLARRKRRRGGRLLAPPKLAALGVTDDLFDDLLPSDEVLIDLGDVNTAYDAAASLVFHHAELLTIQATPATDIVSTIEYADGLDILAGSIWSQAQAHEADPSTPNWVNSQPGTDWKTGQPSKPIYVWSDETVQNLGLPLSDALKTTKNDPMLESQCWTVQPGITRVPMTVAPAAAPGPEDVGDAEAAYTVKEVTPQSGVEHSFAYDPATATATVSLKNHYLRWLQICVDQYAPGPDGQKIGETQTLEPPLGAPDTIMAVPLPPDWSPYAFTFNEQASRATVSFGGLGQVPFDWTYDSGGIIWTAIFNYAVPTLFIALGVASDQAGPAWSDTTKTTVAQLSSPFAEAAAEGPIANVVEGGVGLTDVLAAIANCAAGMLLDAVAGSAALSAYVTANAGQSAAEDAAPFIGWVARAIGSAADVASMIETSVEVASSPATMSIDIERTMDVQVTVSAAESHQYQWPESATHYTISITYDDGPVYAYDGLMDSTTQPSPIVHTFTGLPSGGNITVLACFYSGTGWLAGQGSSASMPAQPTEGGTLVVPEFEITEYLVPLSATTTYTMKEKLSFGPQGRGWSAPPAASVPTATVSDLDASNVGNNLWQLGELALNEPESTLGYLWAASGQNVPLVDTGHQPYSGQLFTFQALSDAAAPESGLKFSGYGYSVKPCLAFPPATMPSPPADGFLLEPDMSGKVMQLRQLSLQPGKPWILSPGQSFGQFTGLQDDLVIHPAGYAVALNTATCKLQVVQLNAPAADTSAPVAAIRAGQGTRPGLLYDPVAVACSLDRIVVLQTSPDYPQGCVCAFDVKGNPVNCFAGGIWLAGLHPEGTANVVVVDLSIESKGYLYVLKYLEPATSSQVLAGDYRLDIYNPDGTFLAQVAGLAAARLQVDLWRNLFTLNYEILQGSGRTEPSVANWIPSTPGAGEDAAMHREGASRQRRQQKP
jgi:hypothetical protein